jgi:hypothetical protein
VGHTSGSGADHERVIGLGKQFAVDLGPLSSERSLGSLHARGMPEFRSGTEQGFTSADEFSDAERCTNGTSRLRRTLLGPIEDSDVTSAGREAGAGVERWKGEIMSDPLVDQELWARGGAPSSSHVLAAPVLRGRNGNLAVAVRATQRTKWADELVIFLRREINDAAGRGLISAGECEQLLARLVLVVDQALASR